MSKNLFNQFMVDHKWAIQQAKYASWWNDGIGDEWEETLWDGLYNIASYMKSKYPSLNRRKYEELLYREVRKTA